MSYPELGGLERRRLSMRDAVHIVVYRHGVIAGEYVTLCGRELGTAESHQSFAVSTCLRCRSYLRLRAESYAAQHPEATTLEVLEVVAKEALAAAVARSAARQHEAVMREMGLLQTDSDN